MPETCQNAYQIEMNWLHKGASYDIIRYDGKSFFARWVEDPKSFNSLLIAPESLGSLLIGENGTPVSEIAQYIDELVFFYVPDEVLNYSDKQLEEYVASNCL